ncbi:recombinase family protein [Muricoccus pecuniae]|uniref:DNA invertase Pin-like site-specific DNA recombinase n=1 Tax=Muricoccus pecuniae TaxID=693023 RepID=A0A840YME7_9PROT|nr:recombinase family protein [Roseomonas pecuniae]MBB5695794.1 DNA invertase Pin-like site-specific DNA recombinase [Roseomonas pecuniae]
MTTPETRFVAYLRVSTEGQGRSGLGLEAQREAVTRHVTGMEGLVVAEFVEVESGRKKERPQLAAALATCRAGRATLVIAKLDRLARNVAFMSNLMESGIEFVAADMPAVNRLTVHILAAVAEDETRMISARTRAALTAARARGVQLGNPRVLARDPAVSAKGNVAQRQNARRHASTVAPYIDQARRAGASTFKEVAEALMARGVTAPRGGRRWSPAQVRRLMLIKQPS